MITRRHVVTGVIVVATGGVATVAVAAGPVVYSEYTTGGSRENRVVDADGTGDRPFGGRDVSGAAVSPDGRRIAQTTLDTHGRARDLDDYTSALKVSAADGSGLRTIATAAADGGGAVLVTVRSPAGRTEGYCNPTRRHGFRDCDGSYGSADTFGGGGPRVLRVWRYVPGAQARFDRVTTARRSALRTLAGAEELAPASGDALLAVTGDAIVRAPLDGGVPTTLARGEDLSLSLAAP